MTLKDNYLEKRRLQGRAFKSLPVNTTMMEVVHEQYEVNELVIPKKQKIIKWTYACLEQSI